MIPRQFHFVFGLRDRAEALHLAHYLCIESCRQINDPDRIFLHCHHEPFGPWWDLIKDTVTVVHVEPDSFVATYRYANRTLNRYRYAHHADFVRLRALADHGGIYADIDTLFVNPVPKRLFAKPFVIGREDDVPCPKMGGLKPSLCNAFLMAEPGAAFTRLWLERLADAFDGSWSNHSGFLPWELSQTYADLVYIERRETFFKHSFTPSGIKTLFEELDPDFSDVVSMHLWAHLWWARSRRDFSTFHGGRLTQDYVRRAQTTYAVAARRFLPPSGTVPESPRFVMLDRAWNELAAIDWRQPLRRLRAYVRGTPQ